MAKLTISDAARVAGVARSTLHRAIRAGRLSVDPDGSLDTAELLRAGYTLQRSTLQKPGGALQDATPRSSGAQQSSPPFATQPLAAVHQERDLLRLERDLLRRELEAAHTREQAAIKREQAAREREALLLRMLEQAQQQSQRLLEAPRSVPAPSAPAPLVRAPEDTAPPARVVSPGREPFPTRGAYDPDAAYARIAALQAQGQSFRQIAAQLTAEGIPTHRGGPWGQSSVRYLLKTYGQ